MLIGFGRPTGVTFSVVGAGATIVGDVDKLVDDSPAQSCRFTWNTGAQTTATTFQLQADWTDAQPVRCLALLGVSLPAGLKVEVRGKPYGGSSFDVDLGGNSLTQVLVEFANGSVGAWWVFDDDIGDLVGIEVMLFNDVDGVIALSAAESFDLGELVAVQADDWSIKPDPTDETTDPSVLRRSRNNQPSRMQRKPCRTIKAELRPTNRESELRELREMLSRFQSCVVIPKWRTAGLLDTALLHRWACFGALSQPIEMRAVEGLPGYFTAPVQVEEYPA